MCMEKINKENKRKDTLSWTVNRESNNNNEKYTFFTIDIEHRP